MWRMSRMLISFFALAGVGFADPLAAQDQGAPGNATVPESEIVVLGIQRSLEDLPVETRSSGSMARITRGLVADAVMFSNCAGLPKAALLHAIIDGKPDTYPSQLALHKYVIRHSGCYPGFPVQPPPPPPAPYFGRCNSQLTSSDVEICRSTFDRGVLFEMALNEFGGGIALSRAQTLNHAVRERFMAREDARNDARDSFGSDYFFTVACMVQIRPEFALGLLSAEAGSERETRLRQLLISDGAPCVGNAKEVTVDPGEFRAFTAEAVYSWAVAVRGTQSLLPAMVDN